MLNLQNEIIDLETDVNKITAKLTDASKIKLTKEEFLNLANSAYDKVLAGSPVEKDIILRKMCLNLTLDNKRTPTFIWREPFATLIEMRQYNSGAETADSFELLSSISEWLFANKMSDIFKLPKIDIATVQLQRLQPSYSY